MPHLTQSCRPWATVSLSVACMSACLHPRADQGVYAVSTRFQSPTCDAAPRPVPWEPAGLVPSELRWDWASRPAGLPVRPPGPSPPTTAGRQPLRDSLNCHLQWEAQVHLLPGGGKGWPCEHSQGPPSSGPAGAPPPQVLGADQSGVQCPGISAEPPDPPTLQRLTFLKKEKWWEA